MRLIWWLLAIASVSLISITLSQQRALDPVQNGSLRITSPLERGLRNLADPIAEFFQGISDRGGLVRENQRLRQEQERLQAQLAASEDAQQRIQQLEQALNVKQNGADDQLLMADVIAQDPSSLKQALAIDRGASDGLDEGMVVLSQNGTLIGTVSRVYDNFAWVRLTTDPDSAINAQVQSNAPSAGTPRGVAQGDLRRELVLDMLPSDANVEEGALVTTSGLGGNYPQALVIGTVKSVEARPQALFKKASLEPAADFSALQTVLVITSFLPARLVAP